MQTSVVGADLSALCERIRAYGLECQNLTNRNGLSRLPVNGIWK